MRLTDPSRGRRPLSVWKDVAADYLEIKGLLGPGARRHLLDALQKEKISTGEIRTPCSFSIGGFLTVVTAGRNISSIWIYDPKKKKIVRWARKNFSAVAAQKASPAGGPVPASPFNGDRYHSGKDWRKKKN